MKVVDIRAYPLKIWTSSSRSRSSSRTVTSRCATVRDSGSRSTRRRWRRRSFH